MKKRVVIIGAGPAGLTAGYELLKNSKEYDVIIVESDKQVGGISKTINYKGNRMDLGGHRFFSKDDRVNNFWQDVLKIQGKPSYDDKKLKREKKFCTDGPDPEKEDDVMLIRSRVSRIYYLNKFFDYPVTLRVQTLKNLGFVKTIQSGLSYIKSVFIKKKETSLENFYINRFGKKLYSIFFEKYTEKLWGRHPKDINSSWGVQRVKGLSILAIFKDGFSKIFHIKNKKETSLIEEFMYPKYGPGQMWEMVAQQFEKMGGKIYKKCNVVKIHKDGNLISYLECTHNDQIIKMTGDIFISSMPIKDLINSMNLVDDNVKRIANGLPYRDFVTVGLLVKKLELKNLTDIKTINNIVPDCWIYVQDSNVKLGRIQIFNNWSPYMVKDINKTVWIGLEYFCNENDDFWNMSKKDRVKFAVRELENMGIVSKKNVIDSHVEKVKKAYPAYFDTYDEIGEVISYLNKIDNLYCVGRNGQHRYNNMDHSMLTSFITVDKILNGDKDKSEIWNVNTEKNYHEEKK